MPERPVSVRAGDVPARVGSDYPAPHDEPCRQRRRHRLGDLFGLTQFGVNLLELPPGAWSSQRHWHEREDEFVYVLDGEVELITDVGATTLSAGMVAGFPAGAPDGHHIVNRSSRPARILEVGTRRSVDVAHYSDIDMVYREEPAGGGYFTRDGRPLQPSQ